MRRRTCEGRGWVAWAGAGLALLLAVPGMFPGNAGAHALLYRVLEPGSMVLVEFHFPDGDKPLFEGYRVFGPDDARPFQSGRINAVGEVSFRPDRAGHWRVVVATEDGHGAEVRVDVGPDGLVAGRTSPGGTSLALRLTAGIGYVLGIFGIVALWRIGRRRRAGA